MSNWRGKTPDSTEQRVQAVLDEAAKRVEALELAHAEERAILEHLFATSRAATFRAVDSADFIERLIGYSPSLTKRQHAALHGIANELIDLARQETRAAYEQGKAQLNARASRRRPDVLDSFFGEVQSEWEDVKQELSAIVRWIRG